MNLDYLFINWIRAFILIVVTYNPTGWCFMAWANDPSSPSGTVFFVGIVLFLAYFYFARLAFKQIHAIGIIVVALVFYFFIIALAELSYTYTWINHLPAEWLLIVIVSLFIGIAVSVRAP